MNKTKAETDATKTTDEISFDKYLDAEVPAGEIRSLQLAKDFQRLYPLFKALTLNSEEEYCIKMAVLLHLSRSEEKVAWTPQEIETDFYWLYETQRKRIIGQLSRSGWLDYQRDMGYYRITPLGKSIISLLQPLSEEMDDALLSTHGMLVMEATKKEMEVESKEEQPRSTNSISLLLQELQQLDSDITGVLASKSEYLLRKANRTVRSKFNIAIKSREHVEEIANEDYESYRLKQRVHERLSGLHARISQMQRAQNDLVARKIILADKSLTQHDVNSFLINSKVEDLAKLGRSFISHPIQVADLIPALMVYETEWQLEKERAIEKKRGWSQQAEMADEGQDDLTKDSKLIHFVSEIDRTLNKKKTFTVEKFVPRDDWNTSSFRFSMLAAFESSGIPNLGNEEIHCDQLTVAYPEYEGITLPVVELNDHLSGVKEITRGIVTKANEE